MARLNPMVIDVERGIRSCDNGCKVDATKRVSEIRWNQDGNGVSGTMHTQYLCKKCYQKLGIEDQNDD